VGLWAVNGLLKSQTNCRKILDRRFRLPVRGKGSLAFVRTFLNAPSSLFPARHDEAWDPNLLAYRDQSLRWVDET
jgi:hypothetical protein